MKYFMLLFFPVIAHAQITHRDLLRKNCPDSKLQQLLVSQTSYRPFPTTADEWKRILPDSISQLIIANGESALKGDFPNVPASVTLDFTRNGNRSRYETISFGKRNRLWNLVLAESIEGKKRFVDAIVDGIWSICEESFWGASAHLFIQKPGSNLPDVEHPVVDLFAAETAANLAFADYFVGQELDKISPLIRRRIYYEINRRIFVPLQSARYAWMGNGNTNAKLNNWAPWIVSNYLAAVLLLEKDQQKRIQYTSQAIQITDQYINGFGDDGGCEEGAHYWSFGPACVLDILNLLSTASGGRVNIYEAQVIRNMGAYIYRTHISGNYFVNIGDSHPQENPEPVMVWRFGKAVDDPNLASFGTWLFGHNGFNINQGFHRSRELFDLINLKSVNNDSKPFHDVGDVWLPDIQLMVARLSNGLFVAAHAGNNGESHNHNDVGDVIVYAGGDPVIIDVGSGTYTARTFSKYRYELWFNSSAYHNLPTINGEQQQAGSVYRADRVTYLKNKQQTAFVMNLEKAYSNAAGISSWKRSIATDQQEIHLVDSVVCNHPLRSLTQSFMTVCEVDIQQPGAIAFKTEHGNKVVMRYDSSWQPVKEPMVLTNEDEQGLKATWQNKTITRILLTRRSPAARGRFEYAITLE